MIILSILIPSIPRRKEFLKKLLCEINKQVEVCNSIHPILGEVEIIVDETKGFLEGGLSIGGKRNKLVQSATGKYCCFIDDDDFISPAYIETILRLAQSDNDVICFNTLFKLDTYWGVIDMSIENKENEQAHPNGIIKRRAWHVCPVKTKLANQFEFQDINYGEDWLWMEQVLTSVKTENKTNQLLYQYNHHKTESEADNIKNENDN